MNGSDIAYELAKQEGRVAWCVFLLGVSVGCLISAAVVAGLFLGGAL